MVNMLADTLVSPTEYMVSYFMQRGWQLPADTVTIPNVMPFFQDVLPTPSSGAQRLLFACPSRECTKRLVSTKSVKLNYLEGNIDALMQAH
jgi:hypothetical protein